MVIGMSLHTFFSIRHARSAAYFARKATEVEEQASGESTDAIQNAHYAYVTGAIFGSVAFLEATINEIYAESQQGKSGMLRNLDQPQLVSISAIFEDERFVKMKMVEKYDSLLVSANGSKLDNGRAPAQDVGILVKLRNGLMHYRASWLDMSSEGMKREGSIYDESLWKQINNRFDFRANASKGQSDAWISAGCAKWAVQSSIAYTDAVFNALQVKSFIDHVRNDLSV